MRTTNDLDPYIQILNLIIQDVQNADDVVFTAQDVSVTLQVVADGCAREGMSFLTKTLPSLGKAIDKALSSQEQILTVPPGFNIREGTNLPTFCGDLFSTVFSQDGRILDKVNVQSIRHLRQLTYLYYKLELPYADEEKQAVLDRFTKTEEEIAKFNKLFAEIAKAVDCNPKGFDRVTPIEYSRIIRQARRLLSGVFSGFDPRDIVPKHGPGAVSTKEVLHRKYMFRRLNPRIHAYWPYDAYFYASGGHVCDRMDELNSLPERDEPAQVILVPKDSRGPRIISEEPLEIQWIQQGLRQAIYDRVESHRLTSRAVRFTDQSLNQYAALVGSFSGKYATLDLKDASDRVTLGLVRLLFPASLVEALEASRSLSTRLPSGEQLVLNKFAPMGSALCFPVMALTIWALLAASSSDQDARESILVYGDDVIVRRDQTLNAITVLESFGLTVNRDKSCYHGLFRESCGMDAYQGICVTPIRIKTVWGAFRDPTTNEYTSYIETSNNLYYKGYVRASDFVARLVEATFWPVPSKDMLLSCPSLAVDFDKERFFRVRYQSLECSVNDYQCKEVKVPTVESRSVHRDMYGWSMLLRFLSEAGTECPENIRSNKLVGRRDNIDGETHALHVKPAKSVRQYTRRDDTKVTWRWLRVGGVMAG